jgi:hypothetical protein
MTYSQPPQRRIEQVRNEVVDLVATTQISPIVNSLEEYQNRYVALKVFVKSQMKTDVDFGIVPGTNKPTLLKPGAEKLCTLFSLSADIPLVASIEDFSGKDHNGEPLLYYRYKCILSWKGQLISTCEGSCNSWETKYRHRWVERKDVPSHLNISSLPTRPGSISEFTFAVKKAETSGKYGKPASYWQMFNDAIANGQARKVMRPTRNGESEAWEIDCTTYRVPNENIFDQINTIQKMAQKRALVGAVLVGTGASEFFTQDLDDMEAY